jgi:hypothetical protein
MMDIEQVLGAMISYYGSDVRRINHFLKVYGFAKILGVMEGLDGDTREILEIAALTHDIGIRNSERKFGDASGAHQQTEGPPEARAMLAALGVGAKKTERVCWLIARHHTYDAIDGADYQLLVEADFLVNIFEDNMSVGAVRSIRGRIFRTPSGLRLLDGLYPDAAR